MLNELSTNLLILLAPWKVACFLRLLWNCLFTWIVAANVCEWHVEYGCVFYCLFMFLHSCDLLFVFVLIDRDSHEVKLLC